MASLSELVSVAQMRQMVETERLSSEEVARLLGESHGGSRGVSARSVRRFCAANGISRAVPDTDLDRAVGSAVEAVGVQAGERRVGASLRRVHPYNHARRQVDTANATNPQTYHAPYFAYNLHIDQNEKLVDYGVVLVAAIDGHSSFAPGFAVMPRKNNIAIYRDLFVPIVQAHGLWETVVADHGTEFHLLLYVQDFLCQNGTRVRANGTLCQRQPYKRLTSTQNNRIERLWREVNIRCGYPLKEAFLHAERTTDFDPHTNTTHAFAGSFFGQELAKCGVQTVLSAWNAHRIPGRGIPESLVTNGYPIPLASIPPADHAVALYEGEGRHLTRESCFGVDPFATDVGQQAARAAAWLQFLRNGGHSVDSLLSDIVSRNFVHFVACLSEFIRLCT